MALYGMPFLILNYGAEMVFVLQTRFVAQKVSEKVRSTVINEFARLFLDTAFMDELFRPQLMYSYISTKELFISLARSTVMRLSNTSLNKLFDLMTMGLKYQLFTIRHPVELVEVTFHHLEELQNILSPEDQKHILPVFDRLQQLVVHLLPGDLAEIRRELLNLLLVRNVSVSVLMESDRQHSDGSFVIPRDRYLSPCVNYEAPGSIRYYNEGSVVKVTKFTHRDADLRVPSFMSPGEWNPTNPATRLTTNNVNLYSSRPDSLALFEYELPCPKGHPSGESTMRNAGHASGLSSVSTCTTDAVMGELNFLSKFVGGAHGKPDAKQSPPEGFKFNLFGLDEDREDGTDPFPRVNTEKNDAAFPNFSSDFLQHMNHMRMKEMINQSNELRRIASAIRGSDDTDKSPVGVSDLLEIMDED